MRTVRCSGRRGVSARGVYPSMHWGRHPHPCGQNSWHTLVKTLPFRNYAMFTEIGRSNSTFLFDVFFLSVFVSTDTFSIVVGITKYSESSLKTKHTHPFNNRLRLKIEHLWILIYQLHLSKYLHFLVRYSNDSFSNCSGFKHYELEWIW